MDEKQMQMLSVKSAVERAVQGYIATFEQTADQYKEGDAGKAFLEAMQRFVAALYVSQQIDKDFQVNMSNGSNLHVSFSASGHRTSVTFMLPQGLRLKSKSTINEYIEPQKIAHPHKPRPENCEEGTLWYDMAADCHFIFTGSEWVIVGTDDFVRHGAVQAEPTKVQSEWPFPTGEAPQDYSELIQTSKDVRDPFTLNDDEVALRAYEKAKKHVERM